MPKDTSLLKCLNCGNYSAGEPVQHRDDCGGSIIVEVITQRVAFSCDHCGSIVDAEPDRCSVCHHNVAFTSVYKEPTLSHMEAVIHLLIDALAKSHSDLPERPMRPGGRDV